MFELIPVGTQIDFLGRRRIAYAVSAFLLIAGIAAVSIRGLNLGIDFAGGTEVSLRFQPDVTVDEEVVRTVASACGVLDPSVVRYGETDAPEFMISFNSVAAVDAALADCPLDEADRKQLSEVDQTSAASSGTTAAVDRLTLALGKRVGPPEILSVEYVGARVGDELRRDGIAALAIAVLMILAYIAFRFSSRFAPGAVVALFHDILITAGVFAIFGLEFDLQVLSALLAILGYSLNDTIIVYDRIRENMALRTKHDLQDVLNRSVNQTLSRTLLTSLTTFAAVLCLLLVGGEVIRPFALAVLIGIVVGTYSSIFIAAPMLLFLEQRFASGAQDTSPKSGSKPATKGAKKPRGKIRAA